MKKRLPSPLSALLLLLLPLLLIAADPSATHLLYLDGTGHPLQDFDLSGGHVTGTLSADRLPTALHPAAITASGTQLSLRAAAPHDRFLQLADPSAGTEYLTLDGLADGAPAFNLRSAPSLRVRAAATNLFTVWASGGVSVGAAPYDPGAGCLAISQSFFATGNASVGGTLYVNGETELDSGALASDGNGVLYGSGAIFIDGDFGTLEANVSLRLAAQPDTPSLPDAGGVKLYVDSVGKLHALHANGTDHILSVP